MADLTPELVLQQINGHLQVALTDQFQIGTYDVKINAGQSMSIDITLVPKKTPA